MSEAPSEETVLDVKGLQTVFFTNSGLFRAVDDVSFSVRRGETLAIVGESGCGKSVTALSIMRLVPDPPGRIVGGSVMLEGSDLLGLDEAAMRRIRGNRMSMIFQEPMTSLNPVMRIGDQIAEAVRLHRSMTRQQAWKQAVDMLRLVRIPEPARRALEYPHQLSGGMRQRAMIAMALACRPALLIADEPTTALDVTIQAQILALVLELQRELGMGLILITHDLGVVAQTAQRVIVMYAGKKVEEAGVEELFANPRHPYTRGSDGLDSGGARFRRQRPCAADRNSRHGAVADQAAGRLRLCAALRARRSHAAASNIRRCNRGAPIIWRRAGARRNSQGRHERGRARCSRSSDLVKHYPVRGGVLRRQIGTVHAVDGVSFTLGVGETLGLVGESGCGKSTVARSILRLVEPTSGGIRLNGTRHHPSQQGRIASGPARRCRSSSRTRSPRSIRA